MISTLKKRIFNQKWWTITMALVSNLLHRRQYGSVSSFNHPTENSIHFYIRPNEFVRICVYVCHRVARVKRKNNRPRKKKKTNITQHKLEHNACQWETIVSVSVYTRVAKRVFFLTVWPVLLSTLHQHPSQHQTKKTLPHFFFRLSLSLFLYIRDVCVCVYSCECLACLGVLVRSWMGTDWSIVGWGNREDK